MNMVYLMILGLAGFRLTSLLYREEGPFNVFGIIRGKLGIVHDLDNNPVGYPDTLFGKLFECFWCLSVWISFGLVLGYIFLPEITIYFALSFAISTISIMIEEVI